MAHLRQSGPSFEGLIDTLDDTTSSNSAVSITDQKHMYRAPTWKTGTVVTSTTTGIGGSFPNLTHTDFPTTGDQISMSDYRSIICNVETGAASFTSGSSKGAVTTVITGFGTAAAIAMMSGGNVTTAIGTALHEGTEYTSSPIPYNGNYGASSFGGSSMNIAGFGQIGTGFGLSLFIVFQGSGAHNLSTPTLICRGNGNILSTTTTGPEGTWNQNNTSVNGGYNMASTFSTSSTTQTSSSGASALKSFRYSTSATGNTTDLTFSSQVRGNGMNFTCKLET